jgi:hypothetical protein
VRERNHPRCPGAYLCVVAQVCLKAKALNDRQVRLHGEDGRAGAGQVLQGNTTAGGRAVQHRVNTHSSKTQADTHDSVHSITASQHVINGFLVSISIMQPPRVSTLEPVHTATTHIAMTTTLPTTQDLSPTLVTCPLRLASTL